MKSVVENNLLRVTYQNLLEFYKHTDIKTIPQDLPSDNRDNLKEIIKNPTDSWRYGNEDDHSKYLATRMDPKKGKSLSQDEIKKVISTSEYKKVLTKALTYRKKINFRDAGSRIDIPRAVSGDDKIFVQQKSASKPVVKLAMNMCVSAMCSDEDLMKISLRTVPVIYALESAGIATEVWLCTFNTGLYCNSIDHALVEVKVKSAQERFNWITFGPLFCTGTYRDNFFKSWCLQPYETTNGLGYPMDANKIKENNNYGYATVVTNQGPGPVESIQDLFSKIKF